MVGSTIGHYNIISEIGRGGMGVVYRAEDSRLGRDVALKFLPSNLSADADQRDQLTSEARVAATLNDPGIASIHAIEEVEGQLFIVMELVPGDDLQTLIEKGPLDVAQVIDIGRQVASALAAAHEKDVIHQDVKSANVMVGPDGRARVLDFGLACCSKQFVEGGTTAGTLAYMAPEQVQGQGVGPQTDLWALGVVLYQMLTGKLPFSADYDAALIYSLLNEQPKSVESFRDDIPQWLSCLVADLLEKDASKRPASARAVVEALDGPADVTPEPESEDKSVAILYFENMSPDKDNDYFCAGITEDLIVDLSRIPGMKVIPRSDVQTFRHQEIGVQTIGEQLGVSHVLEGSVRKSGDKLRITSQLIEVATGFPVWGERYDRLLEDIFEIQDDVSRRIADVLKVSLGREQEKILEQKQNRDFKAYDLYMRGREMLMNNSVEGVTSAIKMLELALDMDPDFSLAHSALAECYNIRYIFHDGAPEWLDKMVQASEAATRLDPDNVEGRFGIAMGHFYRKEYDEARKLLDDIQKNSPNFYPAWRWGSVTSRITGDLERALADALKTVELKPYSEEAWVHVSGAYELLGDKEKAREADRHMMETARKAIEVNPADIVAMSRLASTSVRVGEVDFARETLARLEPLAGENGLVLYNMSCAYALLGDRRAFEHLRKSVSLGYRNGLEYVRQDPDFEQFRDDPEFIKIVNSA